MVTIHAVMMRNKLDSSPTESIKLERVFRSVLPIRFVPTASASRTEPSRRSDVSERLILTYSLKHGADIYFHASIIYKMSTNRLMQHWRRTVSAATCLLRYQLQLVSSELKMVSPRHAGSTEICATCEQEMKACFVSVSVQGTCVEITSDERPHEI